MIWKFEQERLCEKETLRSAILESTSVENLLYPVVSVVGAGGKTTMLHRMADEYASAGQKVFVTTTTHIVDEKKEYFLSDPSAEEIEKILDEFRQVWAGMPASGGKLKGLDEERLKRILAKDIPVLIEADGAKRKPVKLPAGHEPVIREETTHVLAVYGLDALGRSFEEVCFRCDLACAVSGKHREDPVTESDIAAFAASDNGGRKNCPETAVYTVVLNKADDQKRREQALKICRLLSEKGVDRVVITSFAV